MRGMDTAFHPKRQVSREALKPMGGSGDLPGPGGGSGANPNPPANGGMGPHHGNNGWPQPRTDLQESQLRMALNIAMPNRQGWGDEPATPTAQQMRNVANMGAPIRTPSMGMITQMQQPHPAAPAGPRVINPQGDGSFDPTDPANRSINNVTSGAGAGGARVLGTPRPPRYDPLSSANAGSLNTSGVTTGAAAAGGRKENVNRSGVPIGNAAAGGFELTEPTNDEGVGIGSHPVWPTLWSGGGSGVGGGAPTSRTASFNYDNPFGDNGLTSGANMGGSWQRNMMPMSPDLRKHGGALPTTSDALPYHSGQAGRPGHGQTGISGDPGGMQGGLSSSVGRPGYAKSVPTHPAQFGEEAAPQANMSYEVQSGDTLWDIAERTTGNGQNWHDIYNANRDVIGEDPSLILPGQRLNLTGGSPTLPVTR